MSIKIATHDMDAISRPSTVNKTQSSPISGPHYGEILDAQNRVLGLIANGHVLVECLNEILRGAQRSSGGAGCFIVWRNTEGDQLSRGLRCVVSASLPGSLADGIEDSAVNDGEFATVWMKRLSALGLAKSMSIPITSRSGEFLGELVFCCRANNGQDVEIDPHSSETMALLIGFAIEFDRRTRALTSAKERFEALAKNIPGVVYQRVVRPDGDIRYTYISDAAEELFGVSPDEILSDPQALFDTHGPEYYATFHERLLAASRALKLWDVEATIIARDGTRKFTHAIARPHRQEDGSVVWNGVILDQTRIKEAEIAAAAAEARTRDAIIESIPQAFALYDPEDHLVTWNTCFGQLYPMLAEYFEPGTSYSDILRAEIDHGIDPLPEGMDIQARLYERLARHHLTDYAVERQLPNGRWILVNEHRTADGGTVVLHTDISKLKEREAALARSNRELETFASIASHDLQEPLRKIDAFGSRLTLKYHDTLGDDGKMYVERMQGAVDRMRSLINDLLDYSRVTTKAKPFSTVALSSIVSDVLGDLQIAVERSNAHIQTDDLPTIEADGTQMRQLVQNLLSNAIKFRRSDVAPEIRISAATSDDSARSTTGESDYSAIVELRFEDNGIGFDMKYVERIFGVFQRLHGRDEYEGTGIGLATCKKIVERHGGTINASSTPGEGTIFTIRLPVKQPVKAEDNGQ